MEGDAIIFRGNNYDVDCVKLSMNYFWLIFKLKLFLDPWEYFKIIIK